MTRRGSVRSASRTELSNQEGRPPMQVAPLLFSAERVASGGKGGAIFGSTEPSMAGAPGRNTRQNQTLGAKPPGAIGLGHGSCAPTCPAAIPQPTLRYGECGSRRRVRRRRKAWSTCPARRNPSRKLRATLTSHPHPREGCAHPGRLFDEPNRHGVAPHARRSIGVVREVGEVHGHSQSDRGCQRRRIE